MRKITIRSLAAIAFLLAALCANGWSALASEQRDIEMKNLAASSGCNLCHAIEHGKRGADELLPMGPAWEDVAKKYKGQKDSMDHLVPIVLQGSGSRDRHWSGKASGVAMPPNTVEQRTECREAGALDLVVGQNHAPVNIRIATRTRPMGEPS